jgi:hypothetical protein
MLLTVLAAVTGLATSPAPSPSRVAVSDAVSPTAQPADATRVIYIGCQVSEKSALTDCRVVNEGPVDPAAAATALKLAQQMVIPESLAYQTGGHIVVKLNVMP